MSLKTEALAALNELPSVRQGIGALGQKLRRCKPGTSEHQRLWDALTKLENQACELSSTIRLALNSLNDEGTNAKDESA